MKAASRSKAGASSSDDDNAKASEGVERGAATSTSLPRAPAPRPAAGAGLLECLVTPKLPFSVPRDAAWATAADVPQAALLAGFRSRFPAALGGLAGLRFEPVSRRPLPSGDGAGPAIFRLTSADDAEDRVLLGVLRELERALESKHRASLERARTDMLSSSMTFQVMADEIHARQAEARAVFDAESRGLKETLASTSKRLFLLEQEKGALARDVAASHKSCATLQRCVDRLHDENAGLRGRMAALEARLEAVLEAADRGDAVYAAPRAREPPRRPAAAAETQTELVVVACGVAEAKGAAP